MPFLPPNQQRQSDEEGKSIQNKSWISDSAPDPVLLVVSRFENLPISRRMHSLAIMFTNEVVHKMECHITDRNAASQ